jgi:hypothetical protein
VFCRKNPLRCDGYILAGNLNGGQTYFVQIASNSAVSGPVSGDLCLQILDGKDQAPFVPMHLQVHENCIGQQIARLIVSASGGVAPYTYQGAQNGDVLTSGDEYLVVVTDAIGCQQSFLSIVDSCSGNACTTVASFTPTPPSCYGANDGVLSVNIAGGTPPYQYAWSGGFSGSALVNIAPGIYTVTVTDQMGCQVIIADTLTGPAQIIVTPTNIVQPFVGASNGSITVDVTGGSGIFSYSWEQNGTFFANTKDLTNAPAGHYHLVIQDNTNCFSGFDYTLSEVVATTDPVQGIFAEIFPNPAKDRAILAVSCGVPTRLLLTLMDASGKVLHRWTAEQVTEQNIPIDVRQLPAGVYQLSILADREYLLRKVVVGR